MRKLAFVLGMVAFLGLAVAQVPEFPHTVEGNVTVNGEDYTGTVEVRYTGEVLDSTQVEDGVFGEETDPLVPSGIEPESPMKFYIDGIDANTALDYESGAVSGINLSVNIQDDQPTQVSKTVSQGGVEGNQVSVEVPDAASKENSGVSQISINVDEEDSEGVSEVNVTVSNDAENEEVGEIPVEDQEDNVHGNIDVDTNNNDAVENAEIDFKVSQDRIEEDEVSQVVLYHFDDGEFVETLDTTYLEEQTDEDYYYFESETTSFSSFTIASDNQDPEAEIEADQTDIEPGETVEFDATESTDNSEDGIASYEWEFGDGEGSDTDEIVEHTYDDEGTYTVELTVTDRAGNEDSATVEISVEEPDDNGGSINLPDDTTEEADEEEEEQTSDEEETQESDSEEQTETDGSESQDTDQTGQQTNQTETTDEQDQSQQTQQTPTGLFTAETGGLAGVALLVLLSVVVYAQRTGRVDIGEIYSNLVDRLVGEGSTSSSQEYEFK